MSKNNARLELWLKDIAPSDELRKWFAHDPDKWDEFKRRYFKELISKQEQVGALKEKSKVGVVTLLYGTREEKYNNAAALKEYLEAE